MNGFKPRGEVTELFGGSRIACCELSLRRRDLAAEVQGLDRAADDCIDIDVAVLGLRSGGDWALSGRWRCQLIISRLETPLRGSPPPRDAGDVFEYCRGSDVTRLGKSLQLIQDIEVVTSVVPGIDTPHVHRVKESVGGYVGPAKIGCTGGDRRSDRRVNLREAVPVCLVDDARCHVIQRNFPTFRDRGPIL